MVNKTRINFNFIKALPKEQKAKVEALLKQQKANMVKHFRENHNFIKAR